MPSPDTLTTIALAAFMAALLLSMRLIRPAGQQPRHGAAWLDAHDVPAEARHYRPAITAPSPLSALETVPDPVVSPFAPKVA